MSKPARLQIDGMNMAAELLVDCRNAKGANPVWPVSTTQFVGCAIAGISVSEVMKSIWPFYGALLAALMLVTYIPAVSLWLPNMIMGK